MFMWAPILTLGILSTMPGDVEAPRGVHKAFDESAALRPHVALAFFQAS